MRPFFGFCSAFAFFPVFFGIAAGLRKRMNGFFRLGIATYGPTFFPMFFIIVFPFAVSVVGKITVLFAAFFANRFCYASFRSAFVITFFGLCRTTFGGTFFPMLFGVVLPFPVSVRR